MVLAGRLNSEPRLFGIQSLLEITYLGLINCFDGSGFKGFISLLIPNLWVLWPTFSHVLALLFIIMSSYFSLDGRLPVPAVRITWLNFSADWALLLINSISFWYGLFWEGLIVKYLSLGDVSRNLLCWLDVGLTFEFRLRKTLQLRSICFVNSFALMLSVYCVALS